MPRIIYLLLTAGAIHGGHKMIVRHAETLRDLGFNTLCGKGPMHVAPTWFDYDIPFTHPIKLQPDDIVVVPDDVPNTIGNLMRATSRIVVFSQNPYNLAAVGFEPIGRFPPERFPHFIAVAEGLADTIARAFPQAGVEVIHPFADERRFRPAAKRPVIACAPKKRAFEATVIRQLFRQLHPRHASLEWVELNNVTENEMARTLGEAGLFLSLSRLESVGMTTLEAMASGCLCAGFTGIGGREYATPANGLWVDEDDCVAAADALANAADLFLSGAETGRAMVAAGLETAERWSYARFRDSLEATWMRLAPEARLTARAAPPSS